MITIEIRSTMNETFSLIVAKNIRAAIYLVQESHSTKEFKVYLPDETLVTDLFKDLGIGECSKFVTQFNWQKF